MSKHDNDNVTYLYRGWGACYSNKKYKGKDANGNNKYQFKGNIKWTYKVIAEHKYYQGKYNEQMFQKARQYGSFSSTDEEEFEKKKKAAEDVFIETAKFIDMEFEEKGFANLFKMIPDGPYKYKSVISVHAAHFIDSEWDPLYEAASYRYRTDYRVHGPCDHCMDVGTGRRYIALKEQIEESKGKDWIVKNLMPPIGHKKWTAKALEDQLREYCDSDE